MVFIIDDKTISDIIRNHEHTNHAGYYFYRKRRLSTVWQILKFLRE